MFVFVVGGVRICERLLLLLSCLLLVVGVRVGVIRVVIFVVVVDDYPPLLWLLSLSLWQSSLLSWLSL